MPGPGPRTCRSLMFSGQPPRGGSSAFALNPPDPPGGSATEDQPTDRCARSSLTRAYTRGTRIASGIENPIDTGRSACRGPGPTQCSWYSRHVNDRNSTRSIRVRALALPLAVALPIAIAVAVNTLLRPQLAQLLGATRAHSFISYRSFDGWWEVPASAAAAHPASAAFLGASDGAIVVVGIAVAVLAAATVLFLGRTR